MVAEALRKQIEGGYGVRTATIGSGFLATPFAFVRLLDSRLTLIGHEPYLNTDAPIAQLDRAHPSEG